MTYVLPANRPAWTPDAQPATRLFSHLQGLCRCWLVLVLVSMTNLAQSQCFYSPIHYLTRASVTSSAVGDFNGDGMLDLVSSRTDVRNQLEVRLATPSGGVIFKQYTVDSLNYAYSVAVGDLNVDGRLDLAVAGFGGAAVLLGDGLGGFSTPIRLGDYGDYGPFMGVTIADFDKDGKPDLAFAGKGPGVDIFKNDGMIGFRYLTRITFEATLEGRAIAAGDFNADGNADLAVVFVNSVWVSVHLGNGAGGFGAGTRYFAGSTPSSVAAADFNLDGKLDLAVGLYWANSISVLAGNGQGGFRTPSSIVVSRRTDDVLNALSVGDLNQDSRPDMVVTLHSVFKLINCTGMSNMNPEAVANPLQVATLGSPFSYTVNAFFDRETPNDLTYSARIDPGSGLHFDPATRIISGTPTISGVNSVTITATDPGSLSATTSVIISVCAPSDDRAALIDLYKSTDGDNWFFKNGWLVGCNHCSWRGVGCDEQGRVISLSLSSNRLNGSLPASLGNLTHLKSLNLSSNVLSGSIPVSLGNLTQLETLDLRINGLTGGIPASLGKLTKLTFLDFSANALRDPIPPALGEFVNLEWLHLYLNQLTGGIPASLGNLTKIKSLKLNSNQLNGCIPNSLTALCGAGKDIRLDNNAGLPGGGDFAAFCRDGTGSCSPLNTAPVAAVNADQLATVGTAFSYTANPFTDAETPNSLTYTGGIKPANGLVFDTGSRTIQGVPTTSGVTSVTITATDPGGLSASTSFQITVSAGPGSALTITGVTGVACQSLTADQRQLTFTPLYSTPSAQPIAFWVANESTPTTTPGPYSLRLYTDNPTITLMAQQAGQQAAYRYNWLAACASPPPTGFAITGVTSLSCQPITTGQYQVHFTPQYQTQSSEPISFSVVNEMPVTTATGPYSLRVYTDNPIVTLWAQQGGQQTTYRYDWLSGCQAGARQAAASPEQVLRVVVLGNPVQAGDWVELEVRGAEGQPLWLRLVDGQGQPHDQLRVERAGLVERGRLRLGSPAGVYLLEVVTPSRRETLKLVKL